MAEANKAAVANEEFEMMIPKENQQEAEIVMDFLGTLNEEKKREFMQFIEGAKFMQALTQAQTA